jgi:hypothetical protein
MPTNLPYMQIQNNFTTAFEVLCALSATITEGGTLS